MKPIFYTPEEITGLANEAADRHGLDRSLVQALVEQESKYDTWSYKWEPAFQRHYIQPLGLSDTETVARSISWGLMQVMGQSARELGFKGWLSKLNDPETGLEIGCQWFKVKLQKAGGDVHQALQLWNGGGNPTYADEVLARKARIEQQLLAKNVSPMQDPNNQGGPQ